MTSKLKVGELAKSQEKSLIIKETASEENNRDFETDIPYPEEDSDSILDYSNENTEETGPSDENQAEEEDHGPFEELGLDDVERIKFSQLELEDFVKSIAGSFYGAYISKYHPQQLSKTSIIKDTAADEIINFTKVLLQKLRKGV